MEFLNAASPWFWLALAFAIAILEALTGTLLLVTLAGAVALMAVVAAVAPDLAADWRVASPIVVVIWAVGTVILKRWHGARRNLKAATKDVNDV